MGRGISKWGRGSRGRKMWKPRLVCLMVAGPGEQEHHRGEPGRAHLGEQRKNGQLNRRSRSKVEGREVDIAHSTALIFWVKLVISGGWWESGWGWQTIFIDLPKITGLENASFRIRTQVFYLPSSLVFLLKEILNFVQNMRVSLIWDTRPIIFHQVPLHELFWLLSTICPPFLWVLCKSKVGWICGCETHGCGGQTVPQHSVCKGLEQQQSLVSVGAPGTIPCGYWETTTNYFKSSSSNLRLLEKYWGFNLSSFK